MPVIEELIRTEQDGTISFGNYKLGTKSKLQDFEHDGDLYKVKTFYEITKLERNGMFVYESVPGTAVENFTVSNDGVEFEVEGDKDAQLTVQLAEDTEYEVYVDGAAVGGMRTNMSGKLYVSVELNEGTPVAVKINKR
ncbi:endosialidase [Clostridium sp. Marseille-P2415]|uniref:endosialidase n=1 Tax=Clostridium sp. Marseille-P2415 TaxID=1805471 RepID=UPI000988476B|nr:endosialidase [Clostridium sp. Marseille-P2415]